MRSGEGVIQALFYDPAGPAGSLRCEPLLVPRPGQYLQAAADPPKSIQSAEVLPTSLFFSRPARDGFAFTGPVPGTWDPGTRLALRGPLGHGFSMPASARRVALLGYDGPADRLLGLLPQALERGAEVALVCSSPPADLPEEIEILPVQAMLEICEWADFVAVQVDRDSLTPLKQQLHGAKIRAVTQVLVGTPMPCGTLADCGVCAVFVPREWKMACKDGPVFGWEELVEGRRG